MARKTKPYRNNVSITGPATRTVTGRPRLTVIGKIHEEAQRKIANLTNTKPVSITGNVYPAFDLLLAGIERLTDPGAPNFCASTAAEQLAASLEAMATHVRSTPSIIGCALERGALPLQLLLEADSARIQAVSEDIGDGLDS